MEVRFAASVGHESCAQEEAKRLCHEAHLPPPPPPHGILGPEDSRPNPGLGGLSSLRRVPLPTPSRLSAHRKCADKCADWQEPAWPHQVLPMVISCPPSAWEPGGQGLSLPPEVLQSHLVVVGRELGSVDVTSVGGKEGTVKV